MIWHKPLPCFSDLRFDQEPSIDIPGVKYTIRRSRLQFDNGYGASVVNGTHTYGGPALYELAVLHKNEICYDSGLTEDVIGHLSKDEVSEWLVKISRLAVREPKAP